MSGRGMTMGRTQWYTHADKFDDGTVAVGINPDGGNLFVNADGSMTAIVSESTLTIEEAEKQVKSGNFVQTAFEAVGEKVRAASAEQVDRVGTVREFVEAMLKMQETLSEGNI